MQLSPASVAENVGIAVAVEIGGGSVHDLRVGRDGRGVDRGNRQAGKVALAGVEQNAQGAINLDIHNVGHTVVVHVRRHGGPCRVGIGRVRDAHEGAGREEAGKLTPVPETPESAGSVPAGFKREIAGCK